MSTARRARAEGRVRAKGRVITKGRMGTEEQERAKGRVRETLAENNSSIPPFHSIFGPTKLKIVILAF